MSRNAYAGRAHDGAVGLVGQIVEGSHPLLDADVACFGRGELFEPRTTREGLPAYRERRDAAVALCGECGALRACQVYADQHSRHFTGWVIGGRVALTTRTASTTTGAA